MRGFAGPTLAAEVTLAGGHGQIGSMSKHKKLEEQLEKMRMTFEDHGYYKAISMLSIIAGFLMYTCNLVKFLPVVREYKPSVVWLFAAVTLDDYTSWAAQVREASPRSKIWIQTGSVKNAVYLAETAKLDALVIPEP